MKLGMMEIKMVLVHLLRSFELKRCWKTEVELNFSGQVVLNPETITIQLKSRQRI
nr:unnamed protein product [Meloidogyne enterolobii]